MASISLRRSIAWPPAAPSETTSTLVLTSPKRRFVDVRIRLSEAETAAALARGGLLTERLASAHKGDSNAAVRELDWAFAGTSSSSQEPAAGDAGDADAPPVSRGVWRHYVDSRHADAESVVDQGISVEQADGSMLESGTMINPATGVLAPYEEVWLDVAPQAPGTARPRCVVLQLHDNIAAGAQNSWGVVEVLGRFCQGIERTEIDGVTVERWQWTSAEESPHAGWRCVFRSGTGSIPCKFALDTLARLKEGQLVASGAYSWVVTEAADV